MKFIKTIMTAVLLTTAVTEAFASGVADQEKDDLGALAHPYGFQQPKDRRVDLGSAVRDVLLDLGPDSSSSSKKPSPASVLKADLEKAVRVALGATGSDMAAAVVLFNHAIGGRDVRIVDGRAVSCSVSSQGGVGTSEPLVAAVERVVDELSAPPVRELTGDRMDVE